MIFLFLPFSLCTFKRPSQTIAIGIWAGKETISSRVIEQARSWMRFWDEIHVFTDDINPGECESLNKAAFPCKVKCINLGNLAQHLVGTEWKHPWYYAQPRFLPSMASLYDHNRNATWYLFGDDDTYFFRPAIERKIQSLDENDKIVIGKFWSSWVRITQDVPPLRNEHPFAQGGAGVCISHEMMQTIAPHLINCSLSFNDPDFAGSMRFAMCAERVVGQHEWSLNKVIYQWNSGFHSSPPEFEISDDQIKEAPASFHRILSPDLFVPIIRAHIMEYNEKISYDLGLFSFTKAWISLGIEQNRFEYRFGYRIGLPDSKSGLLYAIEPWKPKMVKNKLVGFSQKYQKGVTVHCECDDSIPEGQAFFSHFLDELGSEPVMLLSCSNISYVEHF